MSKVKRLVPWLMGASVIILSFLFLWPQTGWLIRAQLGPTSPTRNVLGLLQDGSPTANPNTLESHLRSNADYQTCLVDALHATSSQGDTHYQAVVKSLWAMTPRFSNEPGLYAHILRFYTTGAVRLNRDEDNLLAGQTPKAERFTAVKSAEDLAGFDRAAAAGEKLDPQNAFFPFMRSAGFLVAHRDRDAVRELQLAGQAQELNDYVAQESLAQEHVWDQRGEHPAALGKMAVFCSILLPHYAIIRSATRVLTYEAVEAEVSHHPEQGLAIRHNLMKVGGLMRRDATTLIGNLVGIAITTTAMTRPGGLRADKPTAGPVTDAQKQARRQQYYNYLRSIGHAEEVQWAEAEIAAGDQVRNIIHKEIDSLPLELQNMERLMVRWLGSLTLLANAIWLLVLAGVATACRPQPRRKFLLIVLVSSLALLTVGAWIWQSPWADCLSSCNSLLADSDNMAISALELKFITLGISIAVPLLLIIVATIHGFIVGRPAGAAVRALRTIAPVLASVLLLVYAGMIVSTARLEATTQADLHRRVIHEGRFLADKTHQVWPG